LYNDQGWRSAFWRRVKQTYCKSRPGKLLVCAAFLPVFALAGAAQDLAGGRNPFRRKRSRGMSRSRDWFDWLGGLPFEVAKPQEVVDFCSRRGLHLLKLDRTRGLGNNQFVFIRS
jgi:2-polyprenyl-6-hydroxyphenyl methylase/3-demethylubiquinone-9 3-methyltransferase